MAVNVSATRTSSLFTDNDGDGVFDPGDILLVKIRITNSGSTDATGVSVTDTLNGLTLVGGSVMVTPIAMHDTLPSVVGHTPATITAAQLIGNDIDPDGAEAALKVTKINGTSVVDGLGNPIVVTIDVGPGTITSNLDGSFTFNSDVGYEGPASFTYTLQDEQGLEGVETATASLTVTDPVWYVNAATGSDVTGDGTYAKPFASLAPLSTGGSSDALDDANDIIFVYNAGTYANASIVLENGQFLIGDGHALLVNGLSIGVNGSNTVLNHDGTAVTLASNNTILGVTLNGNAGQTGAIGILDNGDVGTLTIDETSITGTGKAIQIDSGGALAIDLDQLSSTSSSTQGIHLQGVTGTFNASTGTIQTSTGTGVLIGAAGGAVAGSGGSVAFTYGGDITSPGGSLVEIQDRASGTVTFTGILTEGAGAAGVSGILIDGSAGTINFNGQTFVSVGVGNGVTLTNNTGTINFAATGTGLDITTTTGTGLTFTGGGTLNITGAANSIVTGTGQIMNLQNGAIGANGIAFGTLTSGTVASGNAININNLDGSATFSGGNVTIAGANSAGADEINITGSTATFTFGTTVIDGTFGDAIEINGSANPNGAVTFSSVDIDGVAGHGVNIAGATSAVNINGGSIGSSNDPAGDEVNITGGTGVVTIAATITKTTAGNVVEVENHETGNVTFSGALSATGGVNNGILVNNSNTGTIAFNGQTLISTGANAGVTLTNNTGGTIAFNAGGNGLDITTTTGAGFTATGGGTVTVQGAGNSITSTGGVALTITNTTIGANDVTFQSISANGGSYGIRLNTTGSAGGLHVTGTGTTDGTGGTIQNIGTRGIEALSTAELTLANMTFTNANTVNGTSTDLNITASNAAIYMSSVTGASLNNIDINTTADSGIVGISVSNFVMDNSSITLAGNAADESGIEFSNLSGTSSISNTSISFSETNALDIVNTDVNLTLTLNNVTFSDSQRLTSGGAVNLNGQGGFQFRSFSALGGAPVTSIDILDSDFLRLRTQGIQVAAEDDSIVNVDIVNNIIRSDLGEADTTISIGSGIDLNGTDTANLTFNIIGNTIQTRGGHSVNISSFFDGNVTGRVNGNTITSNGTGAGGSGIRFLAEATSNMIVEARNNMVTAGAANGSAPIEVIARVGSSRLDVTLDNNTVDADPTAVAEFNFQSGSSASGETNQIFANIINNDAVAGGPTNKLRLRISDLDGTSDPRIFLTGFVEGGAGLEDDVVATWNANGNTPAVTATTVNLSMTGGATAPSAGTALVPGNPAASMFVPDPVDPGTGVGVDQTSAQGGETRVEVADDGDGVVTDPTAGGPAPSIGGEGGETPAPAAGADSPAVDVPAADSGIITQADLDRMVEAAIQRWIDAGATPAQVAAMRATSVSVTDMSGLYVGSSTPGTILIDDDGADHGWFVDSTPGEDSEFEGSGTRLTADAGGAAEGRIDLLTVIMHELGHQIGLRDTYMNGEADELMYGYMNLGVRRLPGGDDHVGAVPGSITSSAFALTPVAVGTLPANRIVDVIFKASIDNQVDKFITNLNNTATISGSNFANVNANEINVLDSLTLGSHVFKDTDLDGQFDAGEGVVGVALQIYADTNDSGGWDAGDVLLGSTTTGAGGVYTFAGLAAGDYIVVVTAANFANGAVLDDLLIVQGVAADPDNNVDNDNNGVAATGGAVASQTITLAFNTETTAGMGNDTNNTLDFGFVANQPPVANDDSVSVAEDSGANDLTAQLLLNDTDPENDTRTITGATNGTNGTTSVVAGVLTYTPNGNYNGTDSFTYTIDDGNGHTDTATVNVTVTAVNDPVTTAAPLTASPNEDSVNFAIAGMSIADVDATLAPAGVYDVTLSATNGTLTLTTLTGLTFTIGDGTTDTTMTFHGTLADINTALGTAKYTPTTNYNGSAQITLQATDTFGAVVATGTGSATNDSDVIAVTVNSVNDAPTGANQSSAATEGVEYVFSPTDFSENFTDPIDGNGFGGIRITSTPLTGTLKLNGVAISVPADVTLTQLTNGNLTYLPAAGSAGTSPVFQFRVRDDGGTANGGVDLAIGENAYTINIAAANVAPALDLDANDSSSSIGTGYSGAYTEGGAAAAIGDVDVSITDADSGDDIVSAIITITNAETGDKLNVGTLPATVTIDGTTTDTMVKLVAAPGTSAADFEAAIEAVTFSSTSDNPTDFGTNMSRSITVVVNDGAANSNTATAAIAVTDVNDAPFGTSATISATEDTLRLFAEADFGTADVDGSFASVTISAVTGGKIYVDADGTAGGGVPVEATLPVIFTKQDLLDGKALFQANPNLNGNGVATITFAVTDDDGAIDGTPNLLTVDVSPVNDTPVVPNSPAASVSEGSPAFIVPGLVVSDVDLDALNGGSGNYAGSTFLMNRDTGGNAQDQFILVNGTNFTVTGTILAGGDLQSGGLTFGHWVSSGGVLQIDFNSSQTVATTALVNEVLKAIQYNVVSDTPPATVTLLYGLDDGAPDAVQGPLGSPFNNFDGGQVVLNITATNDGPFLDLLDPGASTDSSIAYTENDPATSLAPTATVTDPDLLDFDGGVLTVSIDTGGTADDRLTVLNAGQISTSGNVINFGGATPIATFTGGTGTTDLVITFNANAGQAEVQAVVRAIAYSNVSDNPSAATRTIGFDVTDGDGGQSNLATATVNFTAVQDPADANNDSASVNENAILNGSVIGNDTDVDGPLPVTVDQVNGSGGNVGVEITLASGAKLTVNADGTYSYNPNGNFNYLTDNTSGAVDITAPDSFSYRLTNGDTANVSITVNGVVSPDDILFGDATNNVITGTVGTDVFMMQDGGNDTVTGGGDVDFFYFGASLDSNDDVDGGGGVDTLALLGDYSMTLDDDQLTGIERLVLYSGGQAALPHVDYFLGTTDAAVAAGATLIVQGKNLASDEQLVFVGQAETDGHFIIVGGAAGDILVGGQLEDSVSGGAGDDALYGKGGDDFIYGGLGADLLRGGMGHDRFYYDDVLQSTAASKDSIADFQIIDRIDLSGIDADGNAGNGDTEFTFIGNAVFGNVAGQLRATESGGIWTVEGDINGDGTADLVISVTTVDPIPLGASDFVL